MDENAPEVGAPGASAETARRAMVQSVRTFGVTAACVQRAEQEHAGRVEVVVGLKSVLTDAQERDARVRAALDSWWGEQIKLHREQIKLHQRQRWSAPQTTGVGAPAAGAPGATARTARQAVVLAVQALGINAARVELAERGRHKFDELVAVLMAMLTDRQKGDAVVLAAGTGKGEAVAWLLAAGADKDTVGSEALPSVFAGVTPLAAAILGGHEEMLHQLLAAGADHEKEATGMRPLMWAASLNRVACVERLLLAGAFVNAQGAHGGSALHFVARRSLTDDDPQERDCHALRVAEKLLEAGADKALVDNLGKTARCYAEVTNHTQVVVLLRE